MKLLLIVGSANDVFIYNYAKWLKSSMNIAIDVFEFYPSSRQDYDNQYYDNVSSAKTSPIRKARGYVDPYIKGVNLNHFMKGKYYDIIHCHWIVSPLVLSKDLKAHCKKLVVTFWGREYANMSLLGSNRRFRKKLNKFMLNVDALLNSKNAWQLLKSQLPTFDGEFYNATLGSAPLEALYNLMSRETKAESKRTLQMPIEKKSVMIGYSGKSLHQHLAIIEELTKHNNLKDKLHLLAPMTRGWVNDYIETVRSALKNSGYTYTLLSGRFLSDDEIGQLRNATDITLQLSSSDGFSRSIIECLCAKSLLIYGDWLGYQRRLEPNGFSGICVNSIEQGVEVLEKVILDMSKYENMLNDNYENGKGQYVWSKCIQYWVNAYNNLLN